MKHEFNLNLLKAAEFDYEQSIKALGGLDIYEEILSDFYTDSISKAKRMISFQKDKDYKNYIIEVHSMKSEAMYLGINNLARMCEAHQQHGLHGDTAYIDLHFNEIMSEITKALTVIKEYLGK